jgi:hypothetical protein
MTAIHSSVAPSIRFDDMTLKKYPNKLWSKWVGPILLSLSRTSTTLHWGIRYASPRKMRSLTYKSRVVDRDDPIELRGEAARRAAEILTRRGMAE